MTVVGLVGRAEHLDEGGGAHLPGLLEQVGVEHEDRHDLSPVGVRRGERRVVVQTEVAAQPEDRGAHPPRYGRPPSPQPPASSLPLAGARTSTTKSRSQSSSHLNH